MFQVELKNGCLHLCIENTRKKQIHANSNFSIIALFNFAEWESAAEVINKLQRTSARLPLEQKQASALREKFESSSSLRERVAKFLFYCKGAKSSACNQRKYVTQLPHSVLDEIKLECKAQRLNYTQLNCSKAINCGEIQRERPGRRLMDLM